MIRIVLAAHFQINENITGTLGYGGTYEIKPGDRIAIIPIGYADGYIRKNKGNYVYINDNKYQIVGNICMDMLFVLVDSDVKVWDKVYLIKDNEHLREVAKYLDTIPYEVILNNTLLVEGVNKGSQNNICFIMFNQKACDIVVLSKTRSRSMSRLL